MKTLVIFAAVLAVSTAGAIPVVDQRSLALQNPELFGGDMLGVDPDDRNAITDLSMRWEGGVIPYVFDSGFPQTERNEVIWAANYITQSTGGCVQIVPRTNQLHYVRVFKGQGCYSYVGCIKRGAQDLSLGNGCVYSGTIIHEVLHAAGFHHEQNRSDRDNYIIIYWGNIQTGMASQFEMLNYYENQLFDSFDYESIMIYGNYAFSKDGRSKTMEDRTGRNILREPYEKNGMTSSDVYRIKRLHGC